MKQGKDFSEHVHRTSGHEISPICPGCKEDISGVALTNLVYTFQACKCKKYPYTHLIETLWHQTCFQKAA